MQNNSWIKIHRKLLDWEWYNDPNTLRVFLHLLLTANYEQKKWRGLTLEPGQLITGRKTLSQRLSLGEQATRSALERLKSTNEITIKTTPQYSMITLVKWRSYQDKNQQTNQQPTNEQPTNNQQITTAKEGKKGRREELKKGIEPKGSRESQAIPDSLPKKFLNNLTKGEPTTMNSDIDHSFPRTRTYGDPNFSWILDYFEHKMSRKIGGSDKWNRIFCRHLKGKIGMGKTKDIIDWISDPDNFWYPIIRNIFDLYKKHGIILDQMKRDESKPKGILDLNKLAD